MLPAGKSTSVSSMLPLPLGVKPVAPPVSVAVNVAPRQRVGQVVDDRGAGRRRWARRW